jgi:GT2 family glycosyltransferase
VSPTDDELHMSAVAEVAVVVLNWNRLADTLTCLESLAASDWTAIAAIVVDNASDEDPGPTIASRFAEAIVIRNDRNLGFAGGMNVGVRRALERGSDYVLLLNNDTVVDRSMVRALVTTAGAHPDAGIISPLVLDRDAPDVVLSAGWSFDPRRGHPGRPLLAGERADERLRGSREIDASSGEAMLVAATTIRDLGLLDEDLYLRLEDVDWSLRMRAAGRRNYVTLDARLWHSGSASSGGAHSPLTAYYHTRNILTVCARHAPMRGLRSAARQAEIMIANLVHARRGEHPVANARAVLAGWRDHRRGRRGPR